MEKRLLWRVSVVLIGWLLVIACAAVGLALWMWASGIGSVELGSGPAWWIKAGLLAGLMLGAALVFVGGHLRHGAAKR